jgi:predicted dehydrogenase
MRKLGQDKGHVAGVAAFLEAIRKGAPPPIPIDVLAAVSLATLAAIDSLATGEPIAVA